MRLWGPRRSGQRPHLQRSCAYEDASTRYRSQASRRRATVLGSTTSPLSYSAQNHLHRHRRCRPPTSWRGDDIVPTIGDSAASFQLVNCTGQFNSVAVPCEDGVLSPATRIADHKSRPAGAATRSCHQREKVAGAEGGARRPDRFVHTAWLVAFEEPLPIVSACSSPRHVPGASAGSAPRPEHLHLHPRPWCGPSEGPNRFPGVPASFGSMIRLP